MACDTSDPIIDDNDTNPQDSLGTVYFPPSNNLSWERTDPDELGWNSDALPDLYNLLEDNGSRAFIILVDGKIVIEKYFGKDLLNISDFNAASDWYWASAGKTLTAALVGIAQEQAYLDIKDPTTQYLGRGWTSMTAEQEDNITIQHQLTMTSGLDDLIFDNHSFDPSKLRFRSEPGTRWAYHNAPYTLLDTVIESAVKSSFETYFNTQLRDKIDMNGEWLWLDNDHVFFSTALSMARFGWLIANDGKWGEDQVIQNIDYINAMRTPSQNINNSYGYLWWLNGQKDYMLPGLQIVFPGSIAPEGPDDMYSGIGKNGQYLSIIPSLNMVMVRMGENPDQVSVPILFQRDIWEAMNEVLPD
ncbi:MAG: beta-lactamase family protein [Saprospiraceae bacterium]|nr:beta-lactamase family protein [Saprospiraceae bacterium]